MIHLGIGRLEIDWGKNEFFRNHSCLFQSKDLGEGPYYYADDLIEFKPAYVRKLRDIVPRLELLGYGMDQCRAKYDYAVREHPDYHRPKQISFDDLAAAVASANVDYVMTSEDYAGADFDYGELAAALLANPEFSKTLGDKAKVDKDEGLFFENLDAYVILRLLAENPSNLDKDVVWGVDDVVEGGYVDEKGIFEPLQDRTKFLIVTEGSSDSDILRKSLTRLFPGVEDFFSFVDVRENYPFTGTGNLTNFCMGLAAIKVLNNVLFIFDNDAAGNEAFQKALAVGLPPNIRCLLLPERQNFREFETIGPSGVESSDINGKAVAIECYLDLEFDRSTKPRVRWTGFNKKLGIYQGELIDKEDYTKGFHKNYTKSGYQLDGLKLVWESILKECKISTLSRAGAP